MSNAKARHRRRWRARRAWNNAGGTTAFLDMLFAGCEALENMAMRTSPLMNAFLGRTSYGARNEYVTPLDPGPIDGARAPWDRGGDEANAEAT